MPPSASPAKRQNPGEKRKTPAKEKDKDGPPPGRDIRNFVSIPTDGVFDRILESTETETDHPALLR
jgi:hypothetical protein